MKQFTCVKDVPDVPALIEKVLRVKGMKNPLFATGKNLSMLFFNPSLRTRMSTQAAAYNLGMTVSALDADQGWKLELQPGAVMNGEAQEHICDAIRVLSSYTDILAVRSFPLLQNKQEDYGEQILNAFLEYSKVPVVSLESATRHPLQSLTDLATIVESGIRRPKIAVTWAPHPKTLPQAVVNSFLEWIPYIDAEVALAHPVGYELDEIFVKGVAVTNNQREALDGADFVYTKNWSSVTHYGQRLPGNEDWTVTSEKMGITREGKFMHCLPVRRNVVATDEVIDQSVVYDQAANRVWAAQAVLMDLLRNS